MAGFPRLPLVNGDTDDDASIHLHAHIGPSQPLRLINELNESNEASSTDKQILLILQDTDDEDHSDFNHYFELFKQGKLADLDEDDQEYQQIDSDSDTYGEDMSADEEWHTEKENDRFNDNSVFNEPQPTVFDEINHVQENVIPDVPQQKRKQWYSSDNYLLYFIVPFGITVLAYLFILGVKAEPTKALVPKDFKSIEHNYRKLNDQLDTLFKRQEFLELSNENLLSTIDNKFEILNKNLKGLERNDVSGVSKSDIVAELLAKLPEHIPVYLKDNKIHFVPEFHRYLYQFIDNYQNETLVWEKFLDKYSEPLKSHISDNLKYMTKDKFEAVLKKQLEENNRNVYNKVSTLIDELNIETTNKTIPTGNKLLLNNLLEIFAKGSTQANYADYNLGARILGFLTSTNLEATTKSSKNLARKIFLGWYDYIQSPKQWKYNGNNVLLDNDSSWKCEGNSCSIGIRLADAIVLTDLIIRHSPAVSISVSIKPKRYDQVGVLSNHVAQYKLEPAKNATNKYLTKFINLISSDTTATVTHIQMPQNFINLKVSVRDIYFEFTSTEPVEIQSIRAYGVRELIAEKSGDDFDQVLHALEASSVLLGDDEFY